MSSTSFRKELGDFNSIVCFRSIVTGLETIMGKDAARGNLIRAGRLRGIQVAKDLGLSQTSMDMQEWVKLVANVLGKNGTRLCRLERIETIDQGYRAYLTETICSAGEESGSDQLLSFTLGAVQGAIEEATGHRLHGVQVGSVLRGDEYDIVDFEIR
ncbi:MAG: hypothetical protein OEW58_09160 [Gammaproteobacteria bacterium]|nr:hypothetical protein [Gammaproteobacteria bacterium]